MEQLGVPFEFAIVASEIGSYKPALGHWRAFEERVGRLPRRSRRGEPLPRRRAGERARPAVGLDQPARRGAGPAADARAAGPDAASPRRWSEVA